MYKYKEHFNLRSFLILALALALPSCVTIKSKGLEKIINMPPAFVTSTGYSLEQDKLIADAVERIRQNVERKKIEEESTCTPVVENLPEKIRRWSDYVDEIYQKVNPNPLVDKCFTYAMMGAESDGYHTFNGKILKSSAGAIGLMQLLPPTARRFVRNPYNDKQNLEAGIEYLNSIVDYLKENYPEWEEFSREEQQNLVSAAYNMGEYGLVSAADRAERNNREIKLPGQTINHIRKVRNNYSEFSGESNS